MIKPLSQYNQKAVGAVGFIVVVLLVTAALNYDRLPWRSDHNQYSAYFAESGGLAVGSRVQVAGLEVGQVSEVTLDGARVRVDFTVKDRIRLGDRTEAAIKTETLLGTRLLDVTPRGGGSLASPIPLDRTRSPYLLPDALGDLVNTVDDLDTGQLNDALLTLSDAFKDTPASLQLAVGGITRFSQAINKRDEQLRNLLADARKVTDVLGERSADIVHLVSQSNSLLVQLRTESEALSQLASNVSALAQQLSGMVRDNKDSMRPALDKLNGVLTMVDDRKDQLKKCLNLLSKFSLSLGEVVSSGPFFQEYLANLAPGQLLQPFIDAAFSDLGLDPATLLPSQLTDPQVGQRATPPLPVPYPRTGQGGEPRMTLPDAITGKPGDPRYPLREEPAQPPPGGPPPGPPAGYDPNAPIVTTPEPGPIEVTPQQPQPPLPPGLR